MSTAAPAHRRPAHRRRGPLWWAPLLALAAVVTALAALEVLPRWPGLVHLVALPPLDIYTDLRLLLTTAPTVTSFVLLLAGMFTVRVLVLALLMGGLTRERIVFAALFYAVLALPLLLAAQVVYLANALLYARMFWAAIGVLAALFFLFAPVPWQGAGRLRSAVARTWRSGLRIEVVIGYGAVVIAIGVLAELVPELTLPLIPVSAAATILAVNRLARPPSGRPLLRLAAAAAALAVAGTVFVATRDTELPEPAPSRPGSIMVMSGIDSESGIGNMFETGTHLFGYDCDQTFYFSYAGPGDGQPRGVARCPLRTGAPYTGEHTQRPFEEQVEVFAEQVADLPRPLVVAGQSHGAWVAWEAVASGAAPEVDALILVGPFPESVASYRPPGEDGPGRVASDLLHLLIPLTGQVGFEFDADAPAAYQLLGSTNGGGAVFDRPLPPGTRALGITASTDLPLMPSGWRMPGVRDACPVRQPHPYLPTSAAYYEEVIRFLHGEPPMECPVFRDWGSHAVLPFSIPPTHVEGPEVPGAPAR